VTPPNGYCPTDGNHHESRTSKFCPTCGYLYEDGETLPGQKKEEAIALESALSSVQTSPEKTHTTLAEKKPTAIYVPAAATQSSKSAAPPVDANGKAVMRTMVEASRQASIQRTSTFGPGKGHSQSSRSAYMFSLCSTANLFRTDMRFLSSGMSQHSYVLVLEVPIYRPSAHQSLCR